MDHASVDPAWSSARSRFRPPRGGNVVLVGGWLGTVALINANLRRKARETSGAEL
jgi:hypothetical protein